MVEKRILITGGAGFIGSHLAEKYLQLGNEVYIIDNLSTGTMDNINHLMNNPKYKQKLHVVIDSILNEDKMLELIGTCDEVIHLAAAVGVNYILENPLLSIKTNVHGTEVVLRLCNKFKKKVLIASTSEVYGKQSRAPLHEDHDVTIGSSKKLRWSYAVGKLIDEFSALAYANAHNLKVVVVRFFNTIGPRQTGDYGMVVPRFVKKALKNETIPVYGDGKQTRTFTHVSEVCDSVIQLMACDAAEGQVINIGGTEEISILELAQRIKKKTNSNSKIELIPYAKAYNSEHFEDMPRRVPSTEKLKSLIGSAPETGLDSILDDIISYYRSTEQ